jgi:hypothetical protein
LSATWSAVASANDTLPSVKLVVAREPDDVVALTLY